MKSIEIVPRKGTRLFGAMVKKQADIRKSGRGTFTRVGARRASAAKWTHVRYRGSISLKPGQLEAVNAVIRSPERGDEARLMSSFLGWLDRHFGEQLTSVGIQYLSPTVRAGRRKR
jgi:hypothetical protein